jgi:hypothetical protein
MNDPNEEAKIGQILAVLTAAILIIGFTVWIILSFTEPSQPVRGDVAPPQDNTPYVGKKW